MHGKSQSPGTGPTRWDVLVVDDESVVRTGVCKILEQDGLCVAAADAAASALTHPALESCRLVLCDLVLPGESGIELVGRLRKLRPQLRIVLITGYATQEQETLALEAGADAFLAKPFDEGELLGIVRRVLEGTERVAEEERS